MAVVTTAAACHSPSAASATSTPAVASIGPSAGDIGGGTAVTITGVNFTNATAVLFGTTNATTFAITSDTSITAISPPGTAGTYVDITVVAPAGTSATSNFDQFTWGQNSLVSFTLSANSVTGGTPIIGTITMTYAAPSAGIALPIVLTSNPPNSTSVIGPLSVVVVGSTSTATFQITTYYVSSEQLVNVATAYNGQAAAARFTIEP